DGVAGDVADRPHQPSPEPVVDAALPLGDQTAGDQLGLGETAPAQNSRDRVPALGREAHPEMLGRGPVETALGQEPSADLRSRGGELFAVVLLGDGVGVEQAAPGAEVGAASPASSVLVVQLDAVAAGQHLDRLDEAEVVDLLDEGDHVPAFAAAEAV